MVGIITTTHPAIRHIPSDTLSVGIVNKIDCIKSIVSLDTELRPPNVGRSYLWWSVLVRRGKRKQVLPGEAFRVYRFGLSARNGRSSPVALLSGGSFTAG